MGRPFDTLYDLTGKKIAVFDANFPNVKPKRFSVSEYVNDVKSELNRAGEYWLGHIYFLTKEQKTESGEYDVIIVHQNKKGVDLSYFIDELKSE